MWQSLSYDLTFSPLYSCTWCRLETDSKQRHNSREEKASWASVYLFMTHTPNQRTGQKAFMLSRYSRSTLCLDPIPLAANASQIVCVPGEQSGALQGETSSTFQSGSLLKTLAWSPQMASVSIRWACNSHTSQQIPSCKDILNQTSNAISAFLKGELWRTLFLIPLFRMTCSTVKTQISQTSCLYFPENVVQGYFICLLGISLISLGISVHADARTSKDPFLIHCLHKLLMSGTCAAHTARKKSIQPTGPRPTSWCWWSIFSKSIQGHGISYTHNKTSG